MPASPKSPTTAVLAWRTPCNPRVARGRGARADARTRGREAPQRARVAADVEDTHRSHAVLRCVHAGRDRGPHWIDGGGPDGCQIHRRTAVEQAREIWQAPARGATTDVLERRSVEEKHHHTRRRRRRGRGHHFRRARRRRRLDARTACGHRQGQRAEAAMVRRRRHAAAANSRGVIFPYETSSHVHHAVAHVAHVAHVANGSASTNPGRAKARQPADHHGIGFDDTHSAGARSVSRLAAGPTSRWSPGGAALAGSDSSAAALEGAQHDTPPNDCSSSRASTCRDGSARMAFRTQSTGSSAGLGYSR